MEDLKELLQQPYSKENWLEIIKYTFSNVSLSEPYNIPFNEDLADKIESYRQFGTVTLADGNRLPLIELKVTQRIRIRQNRVQLRQLIARLIDQENAHGVLAVFDTGEDNYRFSFTAKESDINEEGEFVENETDKKRFTYVLGRNEQTRTAAEQFALLKEKGDSVKIRDVVNAFNVEPLTKEFFDRYKKYYEDFVQYITGKRFERVDGKWKEVKKGEPSVFHQQVFNSVDKDARNYIKLLLGRLVFIKFLQKKSWMGVPVDKVGWQDGDPKFIFNIFNNFSNKEKFHSQALLPLFDHLNAHSESDVFSITNTKVPALNGGLFERQYDNLDILEFPTAFFNDFLDFLEQYNFTIDESDPDDAEVGIDPEMLGHIFENLLEDNKDKGAFYTPKPIVKYMCQESIIEYLYTYFEKNNLLGSDEANVQLKHDIARFIKKHEGSGINDHEKTIAKALKEVKVCDPAIGSGAFPMGILLEIFSAVNLLYDNFTDSTSEVWELDDWNPARIKEHIIRHSIYGVDIEKGAVDIARLRFWLSLIIDEQEPRNLPNLDYKIVVGNSLLPKFNGKVIEIDWSPRLNLQGRAAELHAKVQEYLAEVVDAQRVYFTATNEEKITLKIHIRTSKLQLIKNQSLFNKERFLLSNEIIEDDSSLNTKKKKENQAKKEVLAQFNETANYIENLIGDSSISFSHFDWKLDFPEILNPYLNINFGFDIVIGNPPYFVYEGENSKEIDVIRSSGRYDTACGGKLNAYKLFLSLAPNVLREKGILCLIFQNSFLADISAVNIRKYYVEQQQIIKIDSFPERDNVKKRVFESAKMSVCILFCRNNIQNANHQFCLQIWKDRLKTKSHTCNLSKNEILSINEDTFVIPMINENEKELFIRYYKTSNSKKIKNLSACYRGELNMTTERKYFTPIQNDYLALKGAQIQRFKITNNLSQGVIEYVLKDAYLRDKSRSEKAKHFMQRRLVMQRITGVNEKVRLKASIIDSGTFCADSCNYILENNAVNIEFLLAFINSDIFNWIFGKTSTNSNVNGYEIDSLVIPTLSSELVQQIKAHTIEVMDNNLASVDKDQLISRVNALIFKCYNYSFEEVLVIKPDFLYTEAEYNAIELPEIPEEEQITPESNIESFAEGTLFHNLNKK